MPTTNLKFEGASVGDESTIAAIFYTAIQKVIVVKVVVKVVVKGHDSVFRSSKFNVPRVDD